MRFWLSGPRMLGGMVRPGVSFGPEDLRARRIPAAHLERARATVRQAAKDGGMIVPPDAAIDEWLGSEAARLQRHSLAWVIIAAIAIVPFAAFAIFSFWVAGMLFSELIR